MEAPKVSVIIPVFNAGHRLKTCIESLVNQTLKELELIFVLDCPTDGSDKIVLEYSRQYDNIIVIINERNLNIGMSRNEGLKVSRGEYVAFCDHDDIVMNYMYEDMYNVGRENDADVVLGVPEYRSSDGMLSNVYYYPEEGDIREILLPLIIGKDEKMSQWKFFFSHGVIWDKLYKRNFLINNRILYEDNNKVTFEDNLFLIDCLIHANCAIVINKLMYVHTIDFKNTAATSGYVKTEKVVNYIHCLNALLLKNTLKKKYEINFYKSTVSYIRDCLHRELRQNKWNLIKYKNVLNGLNHDIVIRDNLREAGMALYLLGTGSLFSRIINVFIYKYLTK